MRKNYNKKVKISKKIWEVGKKINLAVTKTVTLIIIIFKKIIIM